MANLVGKVPPLEASGAAVSLVHPTATMVAGQWDVTWPQDMPEEDKPNLGPTRTFGYAHRLVANPPRFARRCVRRDIQIDARDINGWSNAESQMDSAARELSGDVVFQRTLTGDDLGALVPNVDFKQGDVLPLLVWGMIVPATCTSIRYTLEDGSRAVEVGFGPDLQADTAGLAETMSQIDRQMRAEAAGIDEYLAKQLDEAKAGAQKATDKALTEAKQFTTDTVTPVKSTAEAAKTTADTAKQDAGDAKRTAGDAIRAVNDAESNIQRSLDTAKELNEKGQGYAKEAYESYEKAEKSYQDALGAVAELNRLVDESDAILDENEELFKNVETLHGQVGELHRQMVIASAQFRGLLGSAAAHSALAAQHEDAARDHVAKADEIRQGIAPLVQQARDAIDEGRTFVESAQANAKKAQDANAAAQEHAAEAVRLAEQAEGIVESAQDAKDAADTAAGAAQTRLRELREEAKRVDNALSEIDEAQNDVLAMHQTVMEKHGEIIDAHSAAIRVVAQGVKAAGAAAGSASMGAMYAQLTAEDASKAADSAMEAAASNTESITLLEQVQGEHSKAITQVTNATGELRKATDDLIEAGKVQDRINEDLQTAQEVLKDAQADLKAITENLQRADRIQNQAIRAAGAAAGFAAQTGMHAADTAERAAQSAQSALEANALHGEAILASQYTIEYNKIVAEAGLPHYIEFRVKYGELFTPTNDPYFAGASWYGRPGGQRDGLSLNFRSEATPLNIHVQILHNQEDNYRKSTISSYNGTIYPEFLGPNGTVASRHTVPEEADYTQVRLMITPTRIVPHYQAQLDALTAEYRKKGLSV